MADPTTEEAPKEAPQAPKEPMKKVTPKVTIMTAKPPAPPPLPKPTLDEMSAGRAALEVHRKRAEEIAEIVARKADQKPE